MTEDWNIQSPAHACAYTEKPFGKGEPIYTILSIGSDGFRREDICQSAWQAAGGEQIRDKAGVVSFWQHPYVPPPPPTPEPLKKEDAESLLRALLEKNLPEDKEVRYILAVMLERKRILKHRETLVDELKVLIYEHSKTGESFTIEDPRLRLDQIPAIQKRVAALLTPAHAPVPAVEMAPEPD